MEFFAVFITFAVSKQLMMLFAITQQLKDKYPNDNSIRSLELKLIDLYNNGYDVKELDGRVVLTNGKDVFECNILSNDSTIFNSKQLDEKLLSLDSLYDMDGYVLLIGVGLTSATAIHYAEQRAGRKPIIFCLSMALRHLVLD